MFLEIILFDRNNLLSRNHFISPSNLGQWKEEEEDLDSFSLAGLFTSPARTCDCRSCDSQEEQKAENLDKRERERERLTKVGARGGRLSQGSPVLLQ